MSKSGIYIGATGIGAAVTDGNLIPLQDVSYKFGCDVVKQDNTIVVCGKDAAYKVKAILTLTAASTTPITVDILQDGVVVGGGESTITIAGTSAQTVLPVETVVYNGCKCASAVSFRLSGQDATLDVESITVETWGGC